MRTRNRGPKGRHHLSKWQICTLAAAAASLSAGPINAQDANDDTTDESTIEEIVVIGELRSLPGESVESVFGFDKSLLETPRSASTVSFEQIERFNIKDIDGLVALAPGTFTQSFFGVAGSLDVRGTPGETYFRGVRRLDNPGNFPTPIGAADRIDIVRGPSSPISGPSKIGGFLNFEPKSARASGGQYLEENEGAISFTTGRWDQRVLTAEVGGPAKVAGRDFGYYLYAEVEDSGSFYDNTSTDQTIIQASFDMDVNDRLRLQWGGMYHDFDGNQVAGWNRLTQDLIDDSIYTTGSPQGLDTNGDGSISHQEYFALNNPFIFGLIPGQGTTLEELAPDPLLALQNPGTTELSRSNVLVAPDDTLENEDIVLYFDVIYDIAENISIKNQLYFETYDNLNENAYGFSQFADTYVIEDKLVISGAHDLGNLDAAWQVSPSLRYTDFEHGDDFINEYFDRRDLTGPSTALDRRLLATRINDDFSTFSIGDYVNFGIAGLVDLDWDFGLNLTGGVRWDTIDIDSRTPVDLLLFPPGPDDAVDESDTVDGWSWTISVSYETPWGVRPYFTAAEQSTIVAGQGAQIEPQTLADGGAFDTSELLEAGIKGSFLDDNLYVALSFYRQERSDFSAQSIVTNQSTETEGIEFELRWAVTDRLLITGGWSNIEVTNLQTLEDGGRFSFIGSEDLPNIPGSALFGGAPIGVVFREGEEGARRAGTPENIFSFTGTYNFTEQIAGHFSVVDVEAVDSGFSGSVRLPSYTLLNIGGVFENEKFQLGFNVKNVTNERYFRANFPNLFGTTIVLPELPRHYTATLSYNF